MSTDVMRSSRPRCDASTRTPRKLFGGRVDTCLVQGMEESVNTEACLNVDKVVIWIQGERVRERKGNETWV